MSYAFMKDELYHHGIKGMKWGVRRYQNPDGSLTEAGKKRYGEVGLQNRPDDKVIKTERSEITNREVNKKVAADKELAVWSKEVDRFEKKYKLSEIESADVFDDRLYSLHEKSKTDKALSDDLKRYNDASNSISRRMGEYEKAGRKYADDVILSKYGTIASKDTNKTEQLQTGLLVTGIILASPVIVPAAIITAAGSAIYYKHKKPEVYNSNPDVQRLKAQKTAVKK